MGEVRSIILIHMETNRAGKKEVVAYTELFIKENDFPKACWVFFLRLNSL